MSNSIRKLRRGVERQRFAQISKMKPKEGDLENLLKDYLKDLMNGSYSSIEKREHYQEIQPLIQKYEQQKKEKVPDAVKVYNMQKNAVKSSAMYRKLNGKQNFKIKNRAEHQVVQTKKVVDAYQLQINFSKRQNTIKTRNMSKVKAKKTVSKEKSFLEKIFCIFLKKKNTNVRTKPNIRKPRNTSQKRIYRPAIKINSMGYVYNEFERKLRDMRNYSRQNPNYKFYRNGRRINFEPRCY